MFGPYKYIISVDFMEYKKRQSSEHNTMKTGVHNRPQAMIGALYYSPFIMLLLSTQVHPLAAADCHKQNRDPQTWSMFFPPPPRIYVVFFPPPPGIYGFFSFPFFSSQIREIISWQIPVSNDWISLKADGGAHSGDTCNRVRCLRGEERNTSRGAAPPCPRNNSSKTLPKWTFSASALTCPHFKNMVAAGIKY